MNRLSKSFLDKQEHVNRQKQKAVKRYIYWLIDKNFSDFAKAFKLDVSSDINKTRESMFQYIFNFINQFVFRNYSAPNNWLYLFNDFSWTWIQINSRPEFALWWVKPYWYSSTVDYLRNRVREALSTNAPKNILSWLSRIISGNSWIINEESVDKWMWEIILKWTYELTALWKEIIDWYLYVIWVKDSQRLIKRTSMFVDDICNIPEGRQSNSCV